MNFEPIRCADCGSENLNQTASESNPNVAFEWCGNCGEVQ